MGGLAPIHARYEFLFRVMSRLHANGSEGISGKKDCNSYPSFQVLAITIQWEMWGLWQAVYINLVRKEQGFGNT